MSFQQMLREQLQREAAAVWLPERRPEGAVSRARSRRRRRQVVAAGVAIAVVATPLIMLRETADPVSVATPGASGLVPTGPLELDWTRSDDGLSLLDDGFQAEDGPIYAVAGDPTITDRDNPEGKVARGLYRLGDDGTWEPLVLDGEQPLVAHFSEADGVLYAASANRTDPTDGGEDRVALSTSSDGGETWDTQAVGLPDPPSTEVEWTAFQVPTSIESNGSTTLAVVRTSFWPEPDRPLFPQETDPELSDKNLTVEPRDEGMVLVRDPAGEARGDGPSPDESGAEPAGEVIDTIPWAEFGVDGQEALMHDQLFRWTGDAWEPLAGAGDAFADSGSVELQAVGDRFVAKLGNDDGSEATFLTSTDGTSWSPLSLPVETFDAADRAAGGYPTDQVVGVGTALVYIPAEGTVLHVSGDDGATWSEVDLVDAGVVEPGLGPEAVPRITWAAGGPLGLALALTDPDTMHTDLVVTGDLIDWTVTPLAEIVGGDGFQLQGPPIVGEDRIVVTVSESPPADSPSRSSLLTAVGTPVGSQ